MDPTVALWISNTLPSALYTAEQVRYLDRLAMQHIGITGYELMQRAGCAALAVLQERWPKARRIAVVAGPGNNGGDGYVLARYARDAGMAVDLYALVPVERLAGDAARAAHDFIAAGGIPLEGAGLDLQRYEVLVDGVFGTGLTRPPEGAGLEAVRALNAAGKPVLALDLPSGLAADTGAVPGEAVRAAVTVSFIGLKRGLYTGNGPDHCGEIRHAGLGTPELVYRHVQASALLVREFRGCLPPRPRSAHKGSHGHVLVVGGNAGYSGAARLAGEAALRVGAGLVSIATHPGHAAFLNLARPELMVRAAHGPADLQPLLERASVIALGPGLGQDDWACRLWECALASGLPLVLDADGLNLLGRLPRQRGDWVLTPHPGEAGRLLGRSTAEVQADRFAAVAALRDRYGGVVVLKGAGTLILGADGPPALCALGNPGLASGGTGDVLTGVIAGLLAQGLQAAAAARYGVALHAAAADRAAAAGERGLLAGDLMDYLRLLVNLDAHPAAR